MDIQFIGSTVEVPGGPQYLTSFLINGVLAIDAGSLGFWKSHAEQQQIEHVFITHSHIDHVASLPILLENTFTSEPRCITVHGLAATLESLRTDLFNDRIWPDFVSLSQPEAMFVRFEEVLPRQPLALGPYRITAIPVDHVVPTVAYYVETADSGVLFCYDTGPVEEVWEFVNRQSRLNAVFLELTFPESLRWLADVSKHLTPRLFADELRKLKHTTRVIAVHLKARFAAEVEQELAALGLPGVEIGQPGTTYPFGRSLCGDDGC